LDKPCNNRELYDKLRAGQAETTLTFTNRNPIVNYPASSAPLMQSLREELGQALMRCLLEQFDYQTQGEHLQKGEQNGSKLKAETMC